MTLSQGKAVFIWGTVLSAVIFLALTYDSIMPSYAKLPEKDSKELVDYLSGLR